MSRRSPTNERYQKYTEPSGKTRKSAAAAKPSRKAASSTAAKSTTKTASKPAAKPAHADTPEFKFWERIWWISLGLGFACVASALWMQWGMHATGTLRVTSVVLTGLAYLFITAAFLSDWLRLRPMRMGTYQSKAQKQAAAEKAAAKAARKSGAAESVATEDSSTDDDAPTP